MKIHGCFHSDLNGQTAVTRIESSLIIDDFAHPVDCAEPLMTDCISFHLPETMQGSGLAGPSSPTDTGVQTAHLMLLGHACDHLSVAIVANMPIAFGDPFVAVLVSHPNAIDDPVGAMFVAWYANVLGLPCDLVTEISDSNVVYDDAALNLDIDAASCLADYDYLAPSIDDIDCCTQGYE